MSSYQTMKVGELIQALQEYDPDKPVVVFAQEGIYPILGIQDLEREPTFNSRAIELGCGWAPINDNDEDGE